MDKKTVLSNFTNKYIKKNYPLINRVEFVNISYNRNETINFDFIFFCDKEKFMEYLNVNDDYLQIIVNQESKTISGVWMKHLEIFKSDIFNLQEINKQIKLYIKSIYSKKINEFTFKLKFE